jgi:hypothetical protein
MGRQYALHSSHVHRVEFTEDDERLVAASADGVVSQWRLVRHNKGNYSNVKVHQFHPNGGIYETGAAPSFPPALRPSNPSRSNPLYLYHGKCSQ